MEPIISRQRSYSCMNYKEYQTYFGTPPKMPQAPNTKPLDDPFDIPQLCLENQPTQQDQAPNNMIDCRIQYKIDVILQVDNSEANSIGFQSPRKKDFFHSNLQSKTQTQQIESVDLLAVKRPRNRQRSYSENSPLIPRFKIIDFLNTSSKQQDGRSRVGRKQLKLQ